RSPADIKKAWQKLEPELAKQRKERESQGETFTSITREEFEAKLKRVNSPMIVSPRWNHTAPPGGMINYTVGVMNPDPVAFGALAVAVSIGNRNPIVSNAHCLTTFDARRLDQSLVPSENSGRCRKDGLLRQLRLAADFVSRRGHVFRSRVLLLRGGITASSRSATVRCVVASRLCDPP